MERCCGDFGRAESTLALVHICISKCNCLEYDAIRHRHNRIRNCYSNTLHWQRHTYRVGFGRTGSTLVLVHFGIHKIYYLVYSALFTITVAHLPAIQIHYNVNDDTRLRADVNVDWTYGTVSRWLWTNRQYVGTGACSNSNVPLLGTRCTIAPSPLNTHLLFTYAAITMTYVYGAVVAFDAQEVRCHLCTFAF